MTGEDVKQNAFNEIAPALYSVLSILFSLITGAVILIFIGKNPLLYFGQLFVQGMFSPLGLVESIIKMAPLLIISAGLLACFSAGLWNIGVEGQFLIGALLAGWSAPILAGLLPYPVYLISVAALGTIGGMLWVFLPAMLKARYDMNEIITTLMMNWGGHQSGLVVGKGPHQRPHDRPRPDRPDTHAAPALDDSVYINTYRPDSWRCRSFNHALRDPKNHSWV